MIDKQEFHLIKDISKLELPEYIDKPEYVKNKTVGYGLLVIGWTIWMLLFLPLLTFLFWWFEGHTIYQQLVVVNQESPEGLTLLTMMLIIGLLMLSLWFWASYNWIRFNGRDRRQGAQPLNAEQLAAGFDVSVNDIIVFRETKNITLYYDDEGLLKNYDIKADPLKKHHEVLKYLDVHSQNHLDNNQYV